MPLVAQIFQTTKCVLEQSQSRNHRVFMRVQDSEMVLNQNSPQQTSIYKVSRTKIPCQLELEEKCKGSKGHRVISDGAKNRSDSEFQSSETRRQQEM